jgi:hypothetical protein
VPRSHFSISRFSVWAATSRDAIGPEKEWQIVVQASVARNGWVGHSLEGLCDPIGGDGNFRLIAVECQTIAAGEG